MTDPPKTGIPCPLAIPTLFFAAGIACGRYGYIFADYVIYSVLAAAFFANSYLLYYRITSILKPLSLALAFLVIGNANLALIRPAETDKQLDQIASYNLDGVFTGTLATDPSFDGKKGKFIVNATDLITKNGNSIPLNNRILVKTTFPPPTDLAPGDSLLLRASLSIPTNPGTPGSFNYRQYLLDRRIPLTAFIRSPAYLVPFTTSPEATGHTIPARYFPQFLRYKINQFIDSSLLSDKTKSLYKAIITGQRDSIPIDVLDNFRRSGAIHLLAISGMHMGLLALLSGLLINYILRKSTWLMLRWPVWKISAILTLVIMGCYATISGLQPPVVRAFTMASFFIMAIILDRPRSILNIMALAALLILFYEPTALFSASFQLSFAAVTAIILFNNQFSELFQITKTEESSITTTVSWVQSGIIISLVALFATAPITLYHFHQVSFLGPLTTVLTAPLICFWALPLGLISSLLSSISPDIAQHILTTGSIGLRGADIITSSFASIPHASQTLPPPSLFSIAVYYLIGGYLMFFKASGLIRLTAITTMILTISMPKSSYSYRESSELTKITFLDVGQGSSTLIEMPGNINILVDGGGSSSSKFNPGEQIIGPFLWYKSIERLDTLVISHQHQDHFNGLAFIIENFTPKEIWVNGFEERSEKYRDMIKAATKIGARIMVPGQGTIIATGGKSKLTSISNLHQRENPDISINGRSLVLKLENGSRKLILPGDIMADDSQNLIDQKVNLQCDVLLAPHHGSLNSGGYLLVEKGSPKWLVVSASKFKSDNFPDPEFARWCQKRGTAILNTAKYGAITFIFEKNNKLSWQKISRKSNRL